jgi:ABC-type iron transport system FetAB ATPase subunit
MQDPKPRLCARQLTVRFDTRLVLDELEFSLDPGEVVVIEGPSGSGKSTLLRALAGLQELARGALWLDGKPAQTLAPSTYRSLVGYVAQRAVMFAGSVNLQAGPRLRGTQLDEEQLRRLLQGVALAADFTSRSAKELSGGEQQRVALARALALDPKVLLCDEPTAALDPETARSVLCELKAYAAQGAAVVIVSHEPEQASWLAGSAYRFLRGRLQRV